MQALTEIMNTILQTYKSNSRIPHNMDGILTLMVLTWIYLWKSILWTNSFLQSFISIIFMLLILLTYFVLRPWSLVSGRDMKPRLKILRVRVLYCSFILLV